MQGAPYTPYAPAGGTDDYHCTLVNPHVTKSGYIVQAQFYPEQRRGAPRHPLPDPAEAGGPGGQADDKGGKGWTCFGESALPGTASINQISNTPWLTAWAPGHGADVEPAGTGVWLPAGSLVVEQIHYNLLRGDKPVRASAAADHRAVLHPPAAPPARPAPGAAGRARARPP